LVTVLERKPARGYSPRGAAAYYARLAEKPTGPWHGSPAQRGKRPARPAVTRAPVRSPRADRARDGTVARSPTAQRWLDVSKVLPEISRGPQGGCRARKREQGRTGTVVRRRGGANDVGHSVQRRRGRSGGHRRGWLGPAARGRPGVRRRLSIEERSSSEGAHQKGADGGDARTESGTEEGSGGGKPARWTLGRWGKRVRRSGVDGQDEWRAGEKKIGW
jgi:hypothetical protein